MCELWIIAGHTHEVWEGPAYLLEYEGCVCEHWFVVSLGRSYSSCSYNPKRDNKSVREEFVRKSVNKVSPKQDKKNGRNERWKHYELSANIQFFKRRFYAYTWIYASKPDKRLILPPPPPQKKIIGWRNDRNIFSATRLNLNRLRSDRINRSAFLMSTFYRSRNAR